MARSSRPRTVAAQQTMRVCMHAGVVSAGAQGGTGREEPPRLRRPSVRRGARDPLQDAGALHDPGPARRAIAEFLRLPLCMTAAFAAAAVVISLLDRLTGNGPVRQAVSM